MAIHSLLAATAIAAAAALAVSQGNSQGQTGNAGTAEMPAQAQPAAPAPAPEASPAPDQELVCRTQRVTGSLTRTNRVCLTRAEWNEIGARTRNDVSQAQRGAAGGRQCMLDQMGGC